MRWGPKAITALARARVRAGGAVRRRRRRHTHDHHADLVSAGIPARARGIGPRRRGVPRRWRSLRRRRQRPDVTAVSRAERRRHHVRDDVGGAEQRCSRSQSGIGDDARLFAGDDAGRIWAIAADGSATPQLARYDTGSEPITGLAFAPTRLRRFRRTAVRGRGRRRASCASRPAIRPGRHARRRAGEPTSTSCSRARRCSRSTPRNDEIDTVSREREVAPLPSRRLRHARGHRRRPRASEIYVADARRRRAADTVPVAGGAPTARAAYAFDCDCAERARLRRSRRDRVHHDATRPRSAAPPCRGSTREPNFGLAVPRPHRRLRRSRARPRGRVRARGERPGRSGRCGRLDQQLLVQRVARR